MARGTSTATIARRTATIAIAAAAAAGLAACSAGQVTGTDQKQSAIAGVNIDSESGDLALRDLQVEFESPEGYPSGASASLRIWISNESTGVISLTGAWVGEAADQPVENASGEDQAITLVAADDVESIGETEAPDEATESPSAEETTAEGEDAEGSEEDQTGTGEESESPDGTEPTEGEDATEEPAQDEAAAPALLGEADFDVEIAAHEFVRLDRETGDVLVIENLAEPLVPGRALTLTFEFSNGELVTVNVPVGQAASQEEPSYQENPGAGGGH